MPRSADMAEQELLTCPQALFHDVPSDGTVIVAVSGGGDSVALLLLANAWAQASGASLHAVTVDHGLRPDAAAEAAFVAGLCEGLGVAHTTLGWEGHKPNTGIAEAARRARYELIEEFAMEIGAHCLLAGHTADDQAETLLMRNRRSQENGPVTAMPRGLSGIPRLSRLPCGTMLFRPLLGISRAALREYLARIPQPWIEDPSNIDDSYERVRARKLLSHSPALTRCLIRFGEVMTRYRALLARDTARLLSATVSLEPGGVFGFHFGIAAAAPRPVFISALQMLIAAAGGAEHVVSTARIEKLIQSWASGDSRTTLGSCVVERIGGLVRMYREYRNLPTFSIDPQECVLWDGRLVVRNLGREPVSIAPYGHREYGGDLQSIDLPVIPRIALLASPVIRTASGLAWLPLVESRPANEPIEVRLTARAIEHFCPRADFPLLDWLHSLEDARASCLAPKN